MQQITIGGKQDCAVQRVFIEFEYESRNFPLHHHDASKCDMIVCRRHNWKKCPEEIEVLELRKVVERRIG